MSFGEYVVASALSLIFFFLCSVYPECRQELDSLVLISDLYLRYGRNIFYQYHKGYSTVQLMCSETGQLAKAIMPHRGNDRVGGRVKIDKIKIRNSPTSQMSITLTLESTTFSLITIF